MNLICCKNRKKSEPRKSPVIQPTERYIKYLDAIIEEKSFNVSKVIEYGYFGGSVIIKHNEVNPEIKVKILKTHYVGENEKEWRNFNHSNILPLLKMEYLQKSDSYLFYSPAEDTTLREKVEDNLFRKDPQALRRLINWLKDVADVTEYFHATGYTHLNIQEQNMVITKDEVLQISDFHYVSSRNSRTSR